MQRIQCDNAVHKIILYRLHACKIYKSCSILYDSCTFLCLCSNAKLSSIKRLNSMTAASVSPNDIYLM